MRANLVKAVILFLVIAVAVYFFLSVSVAARLIAHGSIINWFLAASIIFIPLLGLVLVIRELIFGLHTQQMASRLQREGGLSVDDLDRDPSGRISREAADRRFQELAADFDAHDWRAWYRIGVAYDDARDRKKARAAMRCAEKLFRESPPDQ